MERLRRAWRRDQREWLAFCVLTLPGLLLFAAFTYWPLAYSAYLSVLNWHPPSPLQPFVGLANYEALLRDPDFRRIVLNTLVYAAGVVVAAQTAALALGMLLAKPVPCRTVFRTAAFAPYITTTAAAAVAWVLMLHPDLGPLRYLYDLAGVRGVNFLGGASWALAAIILLGIWKEIGIASMFFMVGRQNLPEDYYEAARMDGASSFAVFRNVTLPLLTPVMLFLALSGLIASVKIFDSVAIMTEGGPVYPSSSTYVYHLYQLGFRDFRMSYASAMAVVFFVFLVALTALQLRLARRWVHFGR